MNDDVLRQVKFISILIVGLAIIIKPQSLLIMLLFIFGVYISFIGINSLMSCLTLIKFKNDWKYEGVKAFISLTIGLLFIINSSSIATALTGALFVILGLFIIFIGVMAIVRTFDTQTGIILLLIGLVIALFPLGVSNFIARIIGVSLVGISSYLLYTFNSKSF